MPGHIEYVEGTVQTASYDPYAPSQDYYVMGLQDILKKFEGKKVSIVLYEMDGEP